MQTRAHILLRGVDHGGYQQCGQKITYELLSVVWVSRNISEQAQHRTESTIRLYFVDCRMWREQLRRDCFKQLMGNFLGSCNLRRSLCAVAEEYTNGFG